MKYLVIDVGGTFTKYAVMTEDCKFITKGKIETIQEPFQEFINSIEYIYNTYGKDCVGLALSMPGIIDSETGFMYTGGSISSISNINIVEILSSKFKIPVTIENDAKCAAMAELWKGSLENCKNAIAVICGTGIGGAIICNGKVIKGCHFMSGEFSYILTDIYNPMNKENILGYCSGVPALIKLASQKMNISEEEINGEILFSMANCGDKKAIDAIREFANRIAVQITNCQFMFDPEKIAVGGGISAQPLFIQIIKEELKKINSVYPHKNLPIPEITNCKFFNDSNLIGALYVHLCSKEENIDMDKVREFLNMIKNRREGQYLMDFFK